MAISPSRKPPMYSVMSPGAIERLLLNRVKIYSITVDLILAKRYLVADRNLFKV